MVTFSFFDLHNTYFNKEIITNTCLLQSIPRHIKTVLLISINQINITFYTHYKMTNWVETKTGITGLVQSDINTDKIVYVSPKTNYMLIS